MERLQTAPKRDAGLDVVRTLAIVMVLVIHCASAGLTQAPGTADWWGALVWGAAARPAVPLFFLCSGALMLGREISVRRLLTHNLPRILCAMFVWAFAYRLYDMAKGAGITPAGLWDAAKRTLLCQHEFHFYYLHILLLVYACLPAVRVFVRGASRRELEYALAVWFVTGILFPLLQYFWPFTLMRPIAAWWKMPMSFSAVGYALLGHYLRQYGGSIRRGWYAGALAAGLALTFGGCAALSLRNGALSEIFLEGMSPGPMLMAVGWFGLILNRKKARPALWKALTGRLARASFCVYLCHILFLYCFRDHGLASVASPTALSIPLTALLLLGCGWLTWEVLRRIPGVNKYLI